MPSIMNEYQNLKDEILELLERDWGPRCEIKDTVEFPELLEDPEQGRCPACLVYEKFDDFWDYFSPDDEY